ncbi:MULTISPECIES: AraC family transcriptional regulator [Rahnella]|uniref:Helix-turn-helix domain-containing protein n=1 Tax=Rahnella laticis TaxID=2787622 RepID=A0ABS0EB38_9GAMM|nr:MULTISPECIES: helix-turn-helix domain-containing protein [Rahnella]MBF7981318.1 helix-turn-helix domain-containing protein [Rahnella laticis]MBF8001410.1 helix-turn-helix domain-containing protein [Rahnella sp. LAC-M12]
MVKNGHFDKNASAEPDVINLDYRPAGTYSLDIEIFSVSSLKKRLGQRQEQMQLAHQYSFGMLLFITEGECTQWIDFIPVNCKVGSLVMLSPGQAHRFGDETQWDGWIMMLRPKLISAPGLARSPAFNFRVKELTRRIPDHLMLNEHEQGIVAQAIEQMREDSAITSSGDSSEINTLLHHQFFALLLRLSVTYGQNGADGSPGSTKRFKAFKDLVEENYARWHQVAQYASHLGCSEKSLTRAAVQLTGMTAKNIIASRINLEAKRLLANSTTPVALIAEQLGFEEPTNFVKFFKRQVTCTPGEFRRNQWERN